MRYRDSGAEVNSDYAGLSTVPTCPPHRALDTSQRADETCTPHEASIFFLPAISFLLVREGERQRSLDGTFPSDGDRSRLATKRARHPAQHATGH